MIFWFKQLVSLIEKDIFLIHERERNMNKTKNENSESSWIQPGGFQQNFGVTFE